MLKRKKVLVTGASGLLGSNIVNIIKNQYNVYAIYYMHPMNFDSVTCLRLDLTSQKEVESIIIEIKPDWIIHCAACTNVDYCELYPAEAEKLNVFVSEYLASAAKKAGARMIYISTDAVFEGKRGNYRETDHPSPVNIYGETKLKGEQVIQRVLKDYIIIRTNIYGWNMQNKQSLAEWMLAHFRAKQEFNGFRDIYFSPILVNDLIDLMMQMISAGITGVYHIAGSQRCSKYDFGCLLAKVFNLDAGLIKPAISTDSKLIAKRPMDSSLCTAKIANINGLQTPTTISGLLRLKMLEDNGYVNQLKQNLQG